MKLIIADTETTAKAIAPAYPENETMILVFSDNIAKRIKNIPWTELCVAVSDDNRAVVGIKARKDCEVNKRVSASKITEWIVDLKWQYVTPFEIKLDMMQKNKRYLPPRSRFDRIPKKDKKRSSILDDFFTLVLPSETILNLPSEK